LTSELATGEGVAIGTGTLDDIDDVTTGGGVGDTVLTGVIVMPLAGDAC
jgi:hypothetical protein